MIKINSDNSINFEKLKKKHLDYFKQNGLPLLKQQIPSKSRSSFKEKDRFFNFLLRRYKSIIIGNPLVLEAIKEKISKSFPSVYQQIKNKNKSIIDTLKNIYNYKKFTNTYPSKKSPEKWGAYQLVRELNVNVCPYCNRQYTNTFFSIDGKTRPHLDHFLDKVSHPYFAVSLFNLVPCCYVCNSNFKNKQAFSCYSHLHPYQEGFGSKVKFSIDILQKKNENTGKKEYDITDLLNGKNKFRIKVKINKSLVNINNNKDKAFIKKAFNNVRVFKITSLYNSHKDSISELIQKSIIYTPERIEQLYQEFGGLFNSKDEIVRMVVGSYISEEEFGKKVCSKYISDISEELGLLQWLDN
ncbi:hypothetical protein [Bacillus sp. REN10]|uniref:hypothetical protein n=1 Tax=Bacillus sp. REN10 TaxID=2782541 RepID=UPI00193BD9F9|nr:hypothetical protein [Bacillus sp. REN10]